MACVDTVEAYKYFMDNNFDGFQKFTDSCNNNISAINKIIRIFKEFFIAQDNYTKSVSKINVNLAQLSKNPTDCLNSIFDVFSTTFCVFTNVQKEFTDSLNHIVRSLIVTLENNQENAIKVMNSGDLSIVNNFKNICLQLEKARHKYNLTSISNNSSDKVARTTKANYESIVIKYNNIREEYFNIMREGFERSKQYQSAHLETMRKCVKNFGNALNKLIFDMRESVDSLKHFYRLNSKEALFQSWIDSNKTVDDISLNLFPPVVLSPPGCDTPSIEVDNSHSPEMRSKKVLQTPRSPTNPMNDHSSTDQDLSGVFFKESSANNKKNPDKTSIGTLKNSKRRWSGFAIMKKVQSANDINYAPDIKQSNNEDCWQSRTNLNETVAVDDEGFIVRDSNLESMDRLSNSLSSDSSGDANVSRRIKVNIRPQCNSNVASESEVIHAALQLPIPRRDKLKPVQERRVSNIHRSSRHVSQVTRDKYYRRSVSVSELRHTVGNFQTEGTNDDKENSIIPIAIAMTEMVSSDDGGYTCDIQGRLVLAFPMVIKDYLNSSAINQLPPLISLELISHSYDFTSIEILKQYQDVARLETINPKKRSLIITRELLEKISMDSSLAITGNKISFPLLEYLVSVAKNKDQIIECLGKWAHIDEDNVRFNFNISSRYLDDNKFIKLKISLLTDGSITDVSSNGDVRSKKLDDKCWSMDLGKWDNAASVIIDNDNNSLVRLRFSYEFLFDKCSLVMPHLLLRSNKDLVNSYKISLIHYRTISTGNFSQLFVFNIS